MSAGAPTPAIDPVGDVAVALARRATTRGSRGGAPARLLVRSKPFIVGALIVASGSSARSSARRSPPRTLSREPAQRRSRGAVAPTLVRHRPARPRRVLAGDRRLARHHDHRAAGDAAGHRRSAPRSASSPATSAAPSTTSSAGSSRRSSRCRWSSSASLAITSLGTVEPHDHPRDRLRVRAAHRAHGARRGAQRARARLRRRRPAARRARALHHVRRDPAERDGRRSSSSSRSASATPSSRRDPVVPRLRHPAALARLGAADLRPLRPDQRRLLVAGAVPGAPRSRRWSSG